MNMPKATNAVTAIFLILAGLKYFGLDFPFMDQLTGLAGLLGGGGNLLGAFMNSAKK